MTQSSAVLIYEKKSEDENKAESKSINLVEMLNLDCPIANTLMKNPVILNTPGDAHSYEKTEISKWLTVKLSDPQTRADVVGDPHFVPNSTLCLFINELNRLTKDGCTSTPDQVCKQLEKYFICPITQKPMKDPVVASDGFSYERTALEAYLKKYDASPSVNDCKLSKTIITNFTLAQKQKIIAKFCPLENKIDAHDDELNLLVDLAYHSATIAQACLAQGKTLCKLSRYKEALNSIDASLQQRPHDEETLNDRGNILSHLNRFTEAIESFKLAVLLNPTIDTIYNMGTAFLFLDKNDEALKFFNEAIKINPNDMQVLINRSFILLRLCRYQEALEVCKSALILNPNNFVAQTLAGSILSYLGQYQEGLIHFDEALRIKPNDADALSNHKKVLELLASAKTTASSHPATLFSTTVADEKKEESHAASKRVVRDR